MKLSSRPRRSLPPRSAFTGFRFPSEVIVVAVRWYLRFGLSYRDIEELLAERGVEVDHVTVTGGCRGSLPCWLTRLALPGTRGTIALIDSQRTRAGLAGDVVLPASTIAAVAVGFRTLPVPG